jgi:sugar phosphate isomerase/epimerase
MTDWPVGLSTGSFYHLNIFDCLEEIRHGGFLMIEVCSFPRHLDYHNQGFSRRVAEFISQLGMEVYSFHAPFDPSIDITSLNQQRRQHAMEEILKAAEAAAILGAHQFVIHPGPERTRQAPDEEHKLRLENAAFVLNRISRRCQELGIGFVLENMLPHLMFGNISDILWIMGAIEKVTVGACLDTGHANLTGEIDRVIYKLSGHLKMVHINDNLGNFDDHLPPGKGHIDWYQLLVRLAKIGFNGVFILELAGGEKRNIDDVLEEARRARQLLRAISKQLDLNAPESMQ